MPDPSSRPRFLVADQVHGYGLLRMFQIMGEQTRPSLHVVRSIAEAFATLGITSPHFEPLEQGRQPYPTMPQLDGRSLPPHHPTALAATNRRIDLRLAIPLRSWGAECSLVRIVN
jgi:hypothetical protein